MRLLPALLLLLFLAAPLAGAATDPGAREVIEPDGDRTVTAGMLGAETKRIVYGTTDPGDNNPLTGNEGTTAGPGFDEPTWFILDPAGEAEVEAGGVDPEVCADTQGLQSSDDCSTDVAFLATDADGLRVAAAGQAETGVVVTFNPIDGSAVTRTIENALAIGQFAMDRDGTRVAITYRLGVNWHAMLYEWNGNSVSEAWTEDADLGEVPSDLAMAPDGDAFVVTAGEHYYRFTSSSHLPFRSDNQFIGTGRSVAASADADHTSVMGTSSGRLAFHTAGTDNNDQHLNFKRASSPITEVAMTADGTLVAWGNAAGTFGVGSYTASTTIFQVLHESDVGAEPDHIAFDRDGGHVAVLAGGDLMLFAIHEDQVHHLWTDEEPGALVANPTVALSDDGQALLLPRADGVVVYDAVHDLNVTGDTPTLIPGQEGQLTLRLRNDGNRLAVTSLSASGPEGWSVALDQDEVVVAPGQTVQVAVGVTPAPAAEPGTAHVTVTTKDHAGSDVVDRVPVELDRVIDWAIGVREGAPETLSVEAGEPGVFRLFVENRGNTPREAPLRLTVSDNDWDARFATGDGIIPAGQTADLDVRVTPPAGALELEEATVTVRLDGFGEPVTLRAVVGAVFGVELEVPAGIEVQDGGTRAFNVTVRNVGNTEDSVRVGFGDLPVGWEGHFSFALPEVSAKGIPPGEERTLPVTIRVPPGEEIGVPFLVTMRANSFGDPDNVTEEELFVTIIEMAPEEPDDNGSPGLPLVGLLAAVGVAVVVRRRR